MIVDEQAVDTTKHPLEYTWIFWEHTDDKMTYTENINKIYTVNTVEDFWMIWKLLPKPSAFFNSNRYPRKKVSNRSVVGYSIFKDNIFPCWEDPIANTGSEWRIRRFKNLKEVDLVWEEVVLNIIGTQLKPDDDILGARVVDSSHSGRSLYNVEIWFAKDTNAEIVKNSLRKNLEMIDIDKMYLRGHHD